MLKSHGYLYGPIKIPDEKHPGAETLNAIINCLNFDYLQKMFIIRDPRDLLISMYYSFGFSHTFSSNPEIKGYQEIRKERISHLTLNEYVQTEAPTLNRRFKRIKSIINRNCANYKILKYEDLINNFNKFYKELNAQFLLPEIFYQKIFVETRPRKTENIMHHRRSGKTEQYREKLEKDSINRLNRIFKDCLEYFGYKS